MKIVIAAIVAAAFSLPMASLSQANAVRVAPGETAKIDAHSICRKVRNGSANPIMVPTRSSQEWSAAFAGSFLANLGGMPDVSVLPCFDLVPFVKTCGGCHLVIADRSGNYFFSEDASGSTARVNGMIWNDIYALNADPAYQGEFRLDYMTESHPTKPNFVATLPYFTNMDIQEETSLYLMDITDTFAKMTGPQICADPYLRGLGQFGCTNWDW